MGTFLSDGQHFKRKFTFFGFNHYFIQALVQILVPATSSLLPPLLFESPLGVEKIRRAPQPPLLSIAFTSLICTTLYITATIAIVAIFTAGIAALCPCHLIHIGCWGVTGPERVVTEVVCRKAHLRRSGADVVWWELPSVTPPVLKPPGTNSLAVAFNDIPE